MPNDTPANSQAVINLSIHNSDSDTDGALTVGDTLTVVQDITDENGIAPAHERDISWYHVMHPDPEMLSLIPATRYKVLMKGTTFRLVVSYNDDDGYYETGTYTTSQQVAPLTTDTGGYDR